MCHSPRLGVLRPTVAGTVGRPRSPGRLFNYRLLSMRSFRWQVVKYARRILKGAAATKHALAGSAWPEYAVKIISRAKVIQHKYERNVQGSVSMTSAPKGAR